MKKFLLFLVGMVIGVVGTLGCLLLMSSVQQSKAPDGLTMFDEDAECVTTSNLKIFQTLARDAGLAMKSPYEDDLVVLLMDMTGRSSYYDDLIVKVPKHKCARQIGIYRYETKDHRFKTVPVVRVED